MAYLHHTSCPECGSRDNLAVYVDHEYCFGCKYIKFYSYHSRLENNKQKLHPKIVSLPYDIEPVIPAIAEDWLNKYQLTTIELLRNQVVWSESRKLLIFPYFDESNFLYGYQGRYFGTDPEHPKWIGHGNFKSVKKVYTPLTIPKDNSIIIVEDIISTIKTSRIYNTNCLYGSIIDINIYINIYNKYKPKEFIIWLDNDKRKESYRYSSSFKALGIPSRVVSTKLDPKEYTTTEIRNIIESQDTNPKTAL